MLINKFGEVLYGGDLQDGLDLGDQNLQNAVFGGKAIHGLELSGADLRGADFNDSYLYWLNLFAADCSRASFRGAVLEGANLKSSCLKNADLTGTIIKADQLGRPSSLAHADLTGATFTDVIIDGTEYDSATIFPHDFDPDQHGMIWVESKDPWLVNPPCKAI